MTETPPRLCPRSTPSSAHFMRQDELHRWYCPHEHAPEAVRGRFDVPPPYLRQFSASQVVDELRRFLDDEGLLFEFSATEPVLERFAARLRDGSAS